MARDKNDATVCLSSPILRSSLLKRNTADVIWLLSGAHCCHENVETKHDDVADLVVCFYAFFF